MRGASGNGCFCRESHNKVMDKQTKKMRKELGYDDDEDNINTDKESSWLRLLIFFVFVAGIFVMGVYENNAHDILNKAQTFEKAKKYDTAVLGYKIVIEGYPFSYATVGARKGFDRIKKSRKADLEIVKMRIKNTGSFDPYRFWALPLAASLGCGLIFTVMVILRLSFKRNVFPSVLLAMISGTLFVVQLIYSGRIKLENRDIEMFVKGVMNEPQIVFIGSYALIVVCLIVGLSPLRKTENVIN